MPVETKQASPGTVLVAVSGRLALGREVERLAGVIPRVLRLFQLTGIDNLMNPVPDGGERHGLVIALGHQAGDGQQRALVRGIGKFAN